MKIPGPPHRWLKMREAPLAVTRIFEVVRAMYRHPRRDEERDFFVIHAPDWVNVLALTPDRQLVLVRQFRYGIDDFSLEIPGGIVDAGEDPVAAGLRELREETGYVGTEARLIGSVHPNPAMQSNRCHVVLVDDARHATDTQWDADEEFEILTRPVEEVFALAAKGGITHAMVLDALLLLRLQEGCPRPGVV